MDGRKRSKTHQNENDERNIVGACVCSMRILEFNIRHDEQFYRKRIKTPVMWTRIDRCISVDRAQIGNGNKNVKKAICIIKTTTMHANHAFCTFLCLHSTTTTRNCLISRLVEDFNQDNDFLFQFF